MSYLTLKQNLEFSKNELADIDWMRLSMIEDYAQEERDEAQAEVDNLQTQYANLEADLKSRDYHPIFIVVMQSFRVDMSIVIKELSEHVIDYYQEYSDGSTTWTALVDSKFTADEMQEILWVKGVGWCQVNELTEQEIEEYF